jgi:hypothetical protein
MNDFADVSQYTNALGLSSFAQQFADAKEALDQQKKEALMPISELVLGGAGTAGIEKIGSAIKSAVISKGKELIASKLEDAGIPRETIDKVMSGDLKGGFEDALAKAKGMVQDKIAEVKDAVASKVEDLKGQASDAVEQAKTDLQSKIDSVRNQHENGMDGEVGDDDFFPPGTDLNPIGSGGRVGGTQTDVIEEPTAKPAVIGEDPEATFTEPSSSLSESTNIMETSFGQTPPENFPGGVNPGASSEISNVGTDLPEGFTNVIGDVSKTITGVTEGIGEAGTAVTGAVSGAVSGAIEGGTAAASGILEGVGSTVLEGLGAVADVALGPVGLVLGVIGGIIGMWEGTKAPKPMADILNASAQFGA